MYDKIYTKIGFMWKPKKEELKPWKNEPEVCDCKKLRKWVKLSARLLDSHDETTGSMDMKKHYIIQQRMCSWVVSCSTGFGSANTIQVVAPLTSLLKSDRLVDVH